MALTVDQLLVAVRLEDTVENRATVTRLKGGVETWLMTYCPACPDDVLDMVVPMAVGYMLDAPQSSSGRQAYSDVFYYSGVESMVAPFRVARAVPVPNVDEEATP